MVDPIVMTGAIPQVVCGASVARFFLVMAVLGGASIHAFAQVPDEYPKTVLPPLVEEKEVLTIDEAEMLAVANSPEIQEIEARVRAARWACVQAGLPPNPTAGYTASEIGNEGQSGQQGGFIGQRFVRGGKLKYAQAVAAKEVQRLVQALAGERMKIATAVRTAYYDLYLAQQQVALSAELVGLSEEALQTADELADAGEGRRSDALQAKIEGQRAKVQRRQAEARLQARWRRLANLTQNTALVAPTVEVDVERLVQHASWEETKARVLMASPQIAEQVAAIEKAKCEVAYQRAMAVPDLNTQFSVQYDDATGDTVAGVQIGMPIPIWNRNQGGIGRAAAELTASRRRLDSLERGLSRRLADTYGQYESALVQVEAVQQDVLPSAEENLRLAKESYGAGEITYLEMLTAQRTLFQVSLEYLAALNQLSESSQLLEGCLIAEGTVLPEG